MTSNFINHSKSNETTVAMESTVTVSSEAILLNNKIEEDLQSVIRPLNLMQSIFFCSKYSICDDIIRPNTYLYNFVKVFVMIIYRCVCTFHVSTLIVELSKEWWGFNSLFYCLEYTLDFSFFLIGDLIDTVSNIINSYYNIFLVLRFQHMLKLLQINSNELKCFVVSNWTCVIVLNLFCIFFIITYNSYISDQVSYFDIISAYATIAFDFNIVYALLILKFLEKILRVWIEKVGYRRNTEDSEREEYCNIMFDVYLNIHDCYMLIEKTFRHMILFYTTLTAYFSLRNVAAALTVKNLIAAGIPRYISIPFVTHIWNMKNIVIILSLSVECERFNAAMRDVESICVLRMKATDCSYQERRVCKNIQRTQRASSMKMSACGLFFIDAELPLQLSSFITSYTIVLLQFVYL